MKKHGKHKRIDLFIGGYRCDYWFDIQCDEESDDKTLENDLEEFVNTPSIPQ